MSGGGVVVPVTTINVFAVHGDEAVSHFNREPFRHDPSYQQTVEALFWAIPTASEWLSSFGTISGMERLEAMERCIASYNDNLYADTGESDEDAVVAWFERAKQVSV